MSNLRVFALPEASQADPLGGNFSCGGNNDWIRAELSKLAIEVRKTAGTRFIAELRLELYESLWNWAVSISSAFLIIFTILPKFLQLPSQFTTIVDTASVSLSILMIVFTAIQQKSENSIKSRIMRWCALELSELRKEAEIAAADPNCNRIKLKELIDRRNHILGKYDINHKEIDFNTYRFNKPWEFAGQDINRASIKRAIIWEKYFPVFLLALLIAIYAGATLFFFLDYLHRSA